jgi:hypothetical protein
LLVICFALSLFGKSVAPTGLAIVSGTPSLPQAPETAQRSGTVPEAPKGLIQFDIRLVSKTSTTPRGFADSRRIVALTGESNLDDARVKGEAILGPWQREACWKGLGRWYWNGKNEIGAMATSGIFSAAKRQNANSG